MREILLAAVLVALPAAASARTVAASDVAVTLGPRMQAHAALYGAAELPPLEADLRDAVAARAAHAGFTRLELVLEDAVPNHPTVAMRSRNSNFALSSLSRGGAKVSGVAYGAGGARQLRFSWWAADLRDSAGEGVWTDAERAFQQLGAELGRDHVPQRFSGSPPSVWPASGLMLDRNRP